MLHLRLKTLFIGLILASLLMLLTFAALTRYNDATEHLAEAEAQRYRSYLLADEMRQSSDDLTRLARTYVVSGDAKYAAQYWDILAIRNGEKPRPQDYHRIYWDVVAAGETQPRPQDVAMPLAELMKQAGFSAEEFTKLNEVQANSDALVLTETIAMNAVKGRFDDGQGGFTRVGPPDLELAATAEEMSGQAAGERGTLIASARPNANATQLASIRGKLVGTSGPAMLAGFVRFQE